MPAAFRKVRSLSALEWGVLLSSLVWLPYCAASLRLRGFRRTREVLLAEPVGTPGLTVEQQRNLARVAARAVSIAARYGPYRANCLKRSLVLQRWLSRRGIATELRIGVKPETDGLAAHAWIEHQGVVLNDRRDVRNRYRPLLANGEHDTRDFD